MQRALIIIGIALVLIGLAWPLFGRIPWLHLPGDIVIERRHLRVYIPVVTMLIASVVISLLLWLFRR